MNCRSCTTATVFLLITLLAGCGHKTALVPPQKLVPEKINDLRYTLDEKGVTLQWSYPTKMENDDPLRSIESFEVYRAGIPEEEFCQGCPVQFEEPVEIDGEPLGDSGEGRTALYTDTQLKNGYRYVYKVRSRSGWLFSSQDSNIVSFVWTAAPAVP